MANRHTVWAACPRSSLATARNCLWGQPHRCSSAFADGECHRYVLCEVFLARLKLAWGDVDGAASLLAQAGQSARQHNFVYRLPDVVTAQVLMLQRQGHLAAAAHLAQAHDLPLSQARVHLAQGEHSAALAVLSPLRQRVRHRAKRTRRYTCSWTRSHWQSQAASFGCLSTKVPRWRTSCPKQRLLG